MKQIYLAWFLMNYLWLACIGDSWVGKEPGKFLVCEGSNATFLWDYSGSQVTISQISWTFKTVDILTYTGGKTYPDANYVGRVEYISTLGNAALRLNDVSPTDNGVYSVTLTASKFYQSQNAELVVTQDIETCFDSFTMSINQQVVSTSNEEITRTVTSGDSLKVEMQIPDGCNNEAVCDYEGTECGHCHLNTTCVFEVENVQPGKTVAVRVIPCQGVEHSYRIKLLADSTKTVTTQTASSSSTVHRFVNTSATVWTPGSFTDDRYSTTDNTLSSLDEKASAFTKVTKNVYDKTDSNTKLVTWQISLIVIGGILFIVSIVVIIIAYLHKTEKYSSRVHHQRHTHSRVNTSNRLSHKHTESPRNGCSMKYHASTYGQFDQNCAKHSVPTAFPYYYHRFGDPALLVAEGPQSVVNIRSNANSMRYPFSNVTTRYTVSYANTTVPYEPKPDYNF